MWYSNDMFRYMFRAEFVTHPKFKSLAGMVWSLWHWFWRRAVYPTRQPQHKFWLLFWDIL